MALLIPLSILIPLGLVAIILIVVIWWFYSKNKRLYSDLILEKNKLKFYKQQLNEIKNSNENPEKKFEKINKLARAFFKEYHSLEYNLTYSELSREFKRQDKPNHANFCILMSDIRYSGKEITANQIQEIIPNLQEIFEIE